MTPEARRDIEQLIERIAPGSVLVIETQAGTMLEGYARSHPGRKLTRLDAGEAADKLPARGRHEVAVMVDTLEALDKERAEPLLSALRDLYSRRLLVLTRVGEPGRRDESWQSADLIAFGLTELRGYENGEKLFEYNILSYKQTPDWLNPKNWANPEMWGKYRW